MNVKFMLLDHLSELGFNKEEIKKFEENANEFDYKLIDKSCNKCAMWTLKRDTFGYDSKIKKSEQEVIERVQKVITKFNTSIFV